MKTRIIRIQGVPTRVPDGMFTQDNSGPGPSCTATEPYWGDGSGGQVICDLPAHDTGPGGLAHVANNAGYPTGDIIAIWHEVPAVPGDDDED